MNLSILQYGNPILRAKGKRIEEIDDRIRELAANMIETMHAANGIGLAAQQVGEALQLTVIDISQAEDRPSEMKFEGKDVDPKAAMPLILINPEITLDEKTVVETEGCLSFPEITGEIARAKSVVARAQTLDGGTIEIEAGGLLARAIQHEVDHLNGILFIDRMSSAAKAALSSRLKRLQKETRRGCRSKRFIIDRNRAVNERVVLRREIKKLEHRRANHPLIADQRLDDVGVGVLRTRDQFTCSVLFIEVFANFSHPLVVALDRPVWIFILQFHSKECPFLEGKECAF